MTSKAITKGARFIFAGKLNPAAFSAVLWMAGCASAPVADAPSPPDPLAAGWNGEPVCEALHDDARMRILRCTFPPGVGHEWHYHDPHFGYVIRGGSMQITENGETRIVEIPDGVMWQRDERFEHEALNVGDNESQYLIIEMR